MKQVGDHEGLEPEEVNGIRSMQSYVRPSEGDLLGLGDLELLVTQGKAQSILQDPIGIRLQDVVTWPFHHWRGSWGVAVSLQRE